MARYRVVSLTERASVMSGRGMEGRDKMTTPAEGFPLRALCQRLLSYPTIRPGKRDMEKYDTQKHVTRSSPLTSSLFFP